MLIDLFGVPGRNIEMPRIFGHGSERATQAGQKKRGRTEKDLFAFSEEVGRLYTESILSEEVECLCVGSILSEEMGELHAERILSEEAGWLHAGPVLSEGQSVELTVETRKTPQDFKKS